jgi:hypothetical protein
MVVGKPRSSLPITRNGSSMSFNDRAWITDIRYLRTGFYLGVIGDLFCRVVG